MSDTKFVEFPNIGYLTTKFTDEELLPVKKEIKKIKSNFSKYERFSKALVGQIKEEYQIKESLDSLSKLIMPFVSDYEKKYNFVENIFLIDHFPKTFELDNVWVNFQKKHEFNPLHYHSGILSFVIWINVPYLREDENENNLASIQTKGSFHFVFSNILGQAGMYEIPISKEYENVMILFPSKLAHEVYPFYTSNDYRISLSGNIRLARNL